MSLVPTPRDNPRWFVMQSLFQARDDLGLGELVNDEDVNVYLADLLVDRIPAQEGAELYNYDFEVAERLSACDGAQSFYLLKRHADYILVSLGIFQALPRRGGRHLTRNHYVDWGRSYYDRAASFRRQIDRAATARVHVLRKLANGFENYVAVLDHMRAEYLGLRHRLSPGVMFHLEKDAHTGAHGGRLRHAVDALLDAYSLWLTQRSPAHKSEVLSALEKIQKLDPRFTWPTDALD